MPSCVLQNVNLFEFEMIELLLPLPVLSWLPFRLPGRFPADRFPDEKRDCRKPPDPVLVPASSALCSSSSVKMANISEVVFQ